MDERTSAKPDIAPCEVPKEFRDAMAAAAEATVTCIDGTDSDLWRITSHGGETQVWRVDSFALEFELMSKEMSATATGSI